MEREGFHCDHSSLDYHWQWCYCLCLCLLCVCYLVITFFFFFWRESSFSATSESAAPFGKHCAAHMYTRAERLPLIGQFRLKSHIIGWINNRFLNWFNWSRCFYLNNPGFKLPCLVKWPLLYFWLYVTLYVTLQGCYHDDTLCNTHWWFCMFCEWLQ